MKIGKKKVNDYYSSIYKSKFGNNPMQSQYKKIIPIIKSLIKQRKPSDIKKAIDNYAVSNDPFILKQGFDIGYLSSKFDFIISVGGDGTLLEAARGATNQILFAINSDPKWSVGRLCNATSENFADKFESVGIDPGNSTTCQVGIAVFYFMLYFMSGDIGRASMGAHF